MAGETQAAREKMAPLPSWLDAAFVQEALAHAGGTHADTHVQDVEVGYACAPGDNYCSSLFRVSARVRGGGRPLALLLKVLPAAGLWAQLVDEARFFEREAIVLGRVLPAMDALLRQAAPAGVQPFAARCYREARDPEPFVVLQDLGPEGFRMADRLSGLDLAHARLTVRALGRFHGASAALHRRRPELFDGLVSFFDDNRGDTWADFYDNALETTANTIDTYADFPGDYAGKVHALRKTIFQKWKEVNRIRPGKFNVLIHGDFWVNNMLYRYDGTEVQEVRFVDFQLSHVGNPAIDLILLRYTCLTEEVYDNHWETLLEAYRETLAETLELLGEEAPLLDDIRQDLEEGRPYTFLAALFWLTNIKREGKTDLDEIFEADEKRVHRSPALQKWLRKLLPEFDREGMFEDYIESK